MNWCLSASHWIWDEMEVIENSNNAMHVNRTHAFITYICLILWLVIFVRRSVKHVAMFSSRPISMHGLRTLYWRMPLVCHLPVNNKETDKNVTRHVEGANDARERIIVNRRGTEPMECDMQEAATTPKRTPNTLRRSRVDSAVQTELDSEPSPRVQRDLVHSRYMRSPSPTKHYNRNVSCYNFIHISF